MLRHSKNHSLQFLPEQTSIYLFYRVPMAGASGRLECLNIGDQDFSITSQCSTGAEWQKKIFFKFYTEFQTGVIQKHIFGIFLSEDKITQFGVQKYLGWISKKNCIPLSVQDMVRDNIRRNGWILIFWKRWWQEIDIGRLSKVSCSHQCVINLICSSDRMRWQLIRQGPPSNLLGDFFEKEWFHTVPI